MTSVWYGGWCVGGPMHGQKYAHPYRNFYVERTPDWAIREAGRAWPKDKIWPLQRERLGHYFWYELTEEWIWVPGMH